MARWGHFGAPVLIFPTAGGDFEEIERFQLVAALGGLIDAGRIKAYSTDAVATRAWLAATTSVQECVSLEERYDSLLYEEVLQRIRVDCQDDHIEPILVGASLGAATAVMTLFRHPDSFRAAIGLSGVYDGGAGHCDTAPRGNSPIAYVATLAGAQLAQLKRRPITVGSGEGHYENPNDSKRLADALGAKGIACRFSLWGTERDHTWSTWRDQLPRLLTEQL